MIKLKITNVTNSRRALAYLDHHKLNAMILNHVILNHKPEVDKINVIT